MNAIQPWPTPNLYERLVAIGAEIDNHESDLYVKRTTEVDGVLRDYRDACVAMDHLPPMSSRFVSNIDGCIWYDIPFAFQPWWDARVGKPAT